MNPDLLSNGPLLALFGVLGASALTAGGGVLVARFSNRAAEAKAKTDERTAEQAKIASEQANTLAWQEFIQNRVDEAVKKSNEERDLKIEALERAITGVLGELRRVRNSFREYIHKVVATWGSAPEPPELERHILDDLQKDDLEGLLNDVQIKQYRDDKESTS